MTQNQIRYQEHLENVRHNRATEAEYYRHNSATENQSAKELAETSRHNVRGEGISAMNLQENVRHNYQTESINWYTGQNLAGLQQSQSALNYSNVGVQQEQTEIQRINANNQGLYSQEYIDYLKKQNAIQEKRLAVERANTTINALNAASNVVNTAIRGATGIAALIGG